MHNYALAITNFGKISFNTISPLECPVELNLMLFISCRYGYFFIVISYHVLFSPQTLMNVIQTRVETTEHVQTE